jgi:hypothetical protein
MSDPVQIAAAGMFDPECGDKFVVLYALCADGTIWRILPPHGQWTQLPPVPAPRRSAQP